MAHVDLHIPRVTARHGASSIAHIGHAPNPRATASARRLALLVQERVPPPIRDGRIHNRLVLSHVRATGKRRRIGAPTDELLVARTEFPVGRHLMRGAVVGRQDEPGIKKEGIGSLTVHRVD